MANTKKQLPAKVLLPVVTDEEMKTSMEAVGALIKKAMTDGEHYGVIPGCGDKKTLLKPGAELLCEAYGFEPELTFLTHVEDWKAMLGPNWAPLFNYTIQVKLKRKADGSTAGVGVGACNSYEGKYLYREAKRKCPDCGNSTIRRSGFENKGGAFQGLKGWYCSDRDECRGKWDNPNEPLIVNQKNGRSINPDLAAQQNTVLKIAKKRALVDATIMATRSSNFFTQDVEEFADTWEAAEVVEVAVSNPKEMEPASTAQSSSQETNATPPAPGPTEAEVVEEPKVVGKEQIEQLVLAGGPNGWDLHKITEYMCSAFKWKLDQIKENLTWDKWEQVLKHVQENKHEPA